MASLLGDVGHAYREGILDAGKQPELFLLVFFLGSFGFIRTSAHMIRRQVSWWPGNVSVGGTHVHHLVWGICTLLVTGYVAIAFAPPSPWREVLAALFGIGAGLTLDEFALWLNLEDVYWSEKGRQSIDAVVIAGVLAGLVVLGVRVWVDLADEVDAAARAIVAAAGLFGVVVALVCVLKGKPRLAVLGLVLPVAGIPAAVRLAKPGSLWARLYSASRRARAEARFGAEGAR